MEAKWLDRSFRLPLVPSSAEGSSAPLLLPSLHTQFQEWEKKDDGQVVLRSMERNCDCFLISHGTFILPLKNHSNCLSPSFLIHTLFCKWSFPSYLATLISCILIHQPSESPCILEETSTFWTPKFKLTKYNGTKMIFKILSIYLSLSVSPSLTYIYTMKEE